VATPQNRWGIQNIFTSWRENAGPAKWIHFSPKLALKLAWLGLKMIVDKEVPGRVGRPD
jgi:hypothetical protein